MKTDDVIKTIKEIETARIEATINADAAALEKIMDDELVWIHATGRIDSKESWLQKVKSGTVKYIKMESSDTRYRVYGDAVVVTGRGVTAFINKDGEKSSNICYTTIYVKHNNSWKNVSMQVTRNQLAQ